MRHHTLSFKALAETDDAVLATLAGEPRPCAICGDTGLAPNVPCVCAHGRALVREYDEYRRDA